MTAHARAGGRSCMRSATSRADNAEQQARLRDARSADQRRVRRFHARARRAPNGCGRCASRFRLLLEHKRTMDAARAVLADMESTEVRLDQFPRARGHPPLGGDRGAVHSRIAGVLRRRGDAGDAATRRRDPPPANRGRTAPVAGGVRGHRRRHHAAGSERQGDLRQRRRRPHDRLRIAARAARRVDGADHGRASSSSTRKAARSRRRTCPRGRSSPGRPAAKTVIRYRSRQGSAMAVVGPRRASDHRCERRRRAGDQRVSRHHGGARSG